MERTSNPTFSLYVSVAVGLCFIHNILFPFLVNRLLFKRAYCVFTRLHFFCEVSLGTCLMRCWPSTAERTLIEAQRPDALSLLDFFQLSVHLRASAGLQLKLNVQFSCSPTTAAVNLPFKNESAELYNFAEFKREGSQCW